MTGARDGPRKRGLLASAGMRGRSGAGRAGGLLAVLVLTGCAPAAVAPAPSPSPSVAWPMLPGRVLARSQEFGEQHLVVAVADPEAAYARARALLVDAGYQLTKDREARGGGDGQACTTALCVQFTATTDPEHGPSVAYEAFHSTGPVAG